MVSVCVFSMVKPVQCLLNMDRKWIMSISDCMFHIIWAWCNCHNWTLQVRTKTDLVHTRQETFFIQEESMTIYPRGKFAAVEKLQVSVLKRDKKVSAFTTSSIALPSAWKKMFRTFFENRGDTFFNKCGAIYMCYSKLQQNNLFEITQDSPTFLRHPINSHRSINATLVSRNLNLPGLVGQGENPNSFHSS